MNYDKDPAFVSTCISVPCGDPNCKYCDQRTFKCFHCSPPYALEGEKCVSSCNPFFNL